MFRSVKKEIMTVPAQMSYLSQIRDFIEHIGKKYKYSDKVSNSFKLVVDEACTNVIRHGYRDIKGGEITIKAIIRRQSLTIVLIDQGKSYDPRQANTPDLEKYIAIGKKGGLGIMMMRKLMDDVQYNITSKGNELRLTKQREFIPQTRPRAIWENLTMRTRYTIIASSIITILSVTGFTIMYTQADQTTYEKLKEVARSQTLSLADNSADYLETGKFLDLFLQARTVKNNNPELFYEVYIVDTEGKLQARSTPLKGDNLGQYTIPEDTEAQADSVAGFVIYHYERDDMLIYDFSAEIRAGVNRDGRVIGAAHLWMLDEYVQDQASASKLKIIIFFLIGTILAYVGSYYLIDRIVTPFHSLADWVRQVGQGTVDEDEIDIDASDELGEIAQAFNQMTSKFREAQVNLIEQQRLQKELQVAQEIQQMLLPSDFPQVDGYEIASFYEAAKEVGGDLFDFVEVDTDTIGICVADVAGKGVPGSLIMTMIRTALRLEARGNKNPADVLSRVNRFVTDDMKRGMFVTMFYLILDSRKRIIHYASAGHNPMVLYRGSTKQTYYLNPSGFPVGIQLPDISLFDKKIEQDSIRLREDDLLVLYTDGITEAMNQKRELYRDERFLEAIRNNYHYDVGDFVRAVKEDVKQHTQGYPQNDDITYVAIKEKLMLGEVVYSIQKELFDLIEGGMAVKEACEKMRVSQYMYRKYKQIKDNVGWEGLKDVLYSDDYIEKKHLSLEEKTKMFEVIRKNPEMGAKRISDTLNTEEYNFTVIPQHRVYEELRKAKLSSAEKREAFVRRGGKKRIKLPGTPLLTMDGQVILNFESSEQTIAERHGAAPAETRPEPKPDFKREEKTGRTIETRKPVEPPKAVEEKPKVTGEPETSTAEEVAAKPVVGEKPAEPVASTESEVAAAPAPAEVKPETAPETREETTFISLDDLENAGRVKDEAEQEITQTIKKIAADEAGQQQEETAPELVMEVAGVVEEVSQETETVTEEITVEEPVAAQPDRELIELELPEETSGDENLVRETVDPELIDKFFMMINDDMTVVNNTLAGWENGRFSETDLPKIILTLRIASRNPVLKKMPPVLRLFEQVVEVLDAQSKSGNKPEQAELIQFVKEILKYIEKQNILTNSDRILEQVNQFAIMTNKLRMNPADVANAEPSEFEMVRGKITKKKLLKNLTLLEEITKEQRG